MRKMLLVKRKGFNYYTDYTEHYLHNAFQNYGYSIVRDESKSDFSVLVYISETEKYMKMISPFFDNLSEKDIENFCNLFSVAFKSEVKMEDFDESQCNSMYPYKFMLSKNHSAYNEPAYLIDAPPKLERRTYNCNFTTNKVSLMSFVNVGGNISGLKIIFDFSENVEDLQLSDSKISYYANKENTVLDISFDKNDKTFTSNIDSFKTDKGINPKSAVLKGKKRADEEEKHGFRLRILPVSSKHLNLSGKLTIISQGIEIFKDDIPL